MPTFFISETYIRENTPISQNIDIKDVVPNIGPAQDMFIQDILGTTFYLQLWNSFSAQTLTTDETTLVGLIKPTLAYRAAEMTIPFLTFQLKNKGPQTQSGDFSNSVTLAEVNYLRNELENRSQFYETRLRKYLLKNQSLFSGYTSSTNNAIDMVPDKQNSGFDTDTALYPSTTYFNRCGTNFNGFYNTNF